jgi:hypothetical protein
MAKRRVGLWQVRLNASASLHIAGSWYIVEQEPSDSSYQVVLRQVRENL